MQLEFTQLVRALDESVDADTEVAVVVTATGDRVTAHAFGSTDDVISALTAVLSDLVAEHPPARLN